MPETADREYSNLLKENFRGFYEKHAAGFLNFIRKSCGGDPSAAGDIFQESFFRLFRSSPTGLNEYQMKAYLYKTAFRLIIDRSREKSTLPLEESLDFKSSDGGNSDLRIDMEAAFCRLDKRSRTLLWLAHIEGYSHREISEMTGIGEKSLKVILFRKRKKLEKILRAAGYPDGGINGKK